MDRSTLRPVKRFDVSPESTYWTVVFVLAATSLYFATSVELRRGAWTSGGTEAVQSGDTVKVLQVIDGDEVSVQHTESGEAFVIRLLGIKAFDPKVNDPGLSEVGNAAVRELTGLTSGPGKLTVEYEENRSDSAGRLLAWLKADEQDVGERLIRDGYALAYVRYPQPRESRYLAAELQAQTRASGLWAIPKARERAVALRKKWESEREE
jgi:endonuclease YncB( thermonuclease family)